MLPVLHLVLALSAAWAAPEGELLQVFSSSVLLNEVVGFKPILAHHFSAEAPQNCGEGGRLVGRAPLLIECQFAQVGTIHPTFNVCDDKKTFCKAVAASLQVVGRQGSESAPLLKNQDLNQELKHVLVPGFQYGKPEVLMAAAAKNGQPVFAMISTDWCPPCNEAKEHLLSSPLFQKVSAGWFKVYIDGDNLLAAEWQKHIPYRFYPTFVFLNSRFEEVARYSGPLRQAEFAAWAAEVSLQVKDPIVRLKARVLARREGSFVQRFKDLVHGESVGSIHHDETRLLRWALEQNDADLSAQLTEGAQFPELETELNQAELRRLEAESDKTGVDNKDQRIELYQRLLSQLLNGEGWAETLSDFCAFAAKPCASSLVQAEQRLDGLRARKGLTDAEKASLLGEEYYYLSEAYQLIGDKAQEKKIALKCVDEYGKMRSQSVLKLSRAGNMGVVACLEAAGEFSKAELLLKELIEKYPSEPTFLVRMARVLRKAGKPGAALEWVNKGEDVAYGYNWFAAELIKADILLDLKRPEQAKDLLDKALGQLVLDPNANSRNQVTVARLRAAQAKVERVLK